MLIFDNHGWALVIESKIADALTEDQLQRHQKTVERYGFDKITGLTMTVREPDFRLDGWRRVSWREIYSWAQEQKQRSNWAGFLVGYFNAAESRMANDQYLKEGTITEFSGNSFDPYT